MKFAKNSSSTFLFHFKTLIHWFCATILQLFSQFLQFFLKMTSLDSITEESPIAPLLPVPSTRLRSLILKKHLTTFYAKLTNERRADPHLTRLILLNMFQILQVTKINFDHYLKLHKHPDTYIIQCDATTQTEYTTIRPNFFENFIQQISYRTRKNRILHHIGPQMNVTQLTTNFKKNPLKLLSTTILCTNHILRFPFDGNLQPIQSVNIPDDIILQ